MKKKKTYPVYICIICLILSIVLSGCTLQSDQKKQETNDTVQNEFEQYHFYKKEYLSRYCHYQDNHQDLSIKDIITYVNMNRDYDFYEKIILQNQPLSIHTLVNKYYQLPLSYEPDDLVEINDTSLHYGAKYSKHTARKIVYDDFQALVHSCQKQGFELYVCSGYRSSTWQKEIY